MLGRGPWCRLSDLAVLFRRIRQRLDPVRHQRQLDVTQNRSDRALPFTEYPACEMCGSRESREVLVARDGNRIVECVGCGLWFASPRIPEPLWSQWLSHQGNERNRLVTENRLRYGVALERNIPYAFSFWWKVKRWRYDQLVHQLVHAHGAKPRRFFDVGCGVGFLLKCAKDAGLQVSGNDLNAYAVLRMREVFGLDVHACRLAELACNPEYEGTQDIVVMRDYIEHSYHPLEDLRAAYRLLAADGVVYLHNFFVDSELGKQCGAEWDQYMWNHVYHFSSASLPAMVEKAGFRIEQSCLDQRAGYITLLARKVGTARDAG